MHLERAGSWLSVTPLGRARVEARVDGALSYFRDAEPHADAAIVAADDSLEDLRILHSESAPHTARYALSASGDVLTFEQRDGSILALGERARVLFRSLPAYALDADGERREARIALACQSARACEITVAVDSGGPYPLVVDPTWVSGPGWPDEAIVALNSLWLRQNSATTGDVAVIDASAGPTLDSQVEAAVGDSASLFGSVTADSIKVKQGGLVTGAASYNTLDNNGTIEGALEPALASAIDHDARLPDFLRRHDRRRAARRRRPHARRRQLRHGQAPRRHEQ